MRRVQAPWSLQALLRPAPHNFEQDHWCTLRAASLNADYRVLQIYPRSKGVDLDGKPHPLGVYQWQGTQLEWISEILKRLCSHKACQEALMKEFTLDEETYIKANMWDKIEEVRGDTFKNRNPTVLLGWGIGHHELRKLLKELGYKRAKVPKQGSERRMFVRTREKDNRIGDVAATVVLDSKIQELQTDPTVCDRPGWPDKNTV